LQILSLPRKGGVAQYLGVVGDALSWFVLFVRGGLYGGIDVAGGGSHDSAGVADEPGDRIGPGDRKGRPYISDVGYDT
jgi:hypothetical protein